MGHLDALNTANQARTTGDIRVLNRIANAYGLQTGSSPLAVYKTIVNRVAPEITRAYVGGGGALTDRIGDATDFDPSLSPDQVKNNIATSVHLLGSKIKSSQAQYDRGTYGRGKQKLIQPENEEIMKRLGGGGTPTISNRADYDKLPSGAQFIDAGDGKLKTKR